MIWIKMGSLMMFCAVALGAFGSHMLRSKLSEHYFDVFQTGIFYHFIHALALFVVAWLATQGVDPKINMAGWCFTVGIVFFSGSLYLLATTQMKIFGPITPIGGLSFLAGWLLLFISKV